MPKRGIVSNRQTKRRAKKAFKEIINSSSSLHSDIPDEDNDTDSRDINQEFEG